MKLFEYMAKEVFRRYGIPVPAGRMVTSAEAAGEAASDLGGAVVLKSQVLVGGRGKAGGIKFADSPAEAGRVAQELLGTEIRGHVVERLLVEEKLDIQRELYLGFAIDASDRTVLLIASSCGGMSIEEVPEKDIVKYPVGVVWGLRPYMARQVSKALGMTGTVARQVEDIALKLYHLFMECDGELTEINPLVVCGERVVAADGRLNIDDESLFRHSDLPRTSEATELESKVRSLGLSYVELEGDIAVMANGAGITMATMDILGQYGGRAMNFLDAGGGASMEPMAQALGILVSTQPRAILVNIFGGITRCDDVARAISKVKREMGIPVPLVVRLVGTNEDEGVRILQEAGVEAFSELDEAARRVVELARG